MHCFTFKKQVNKGIIFVYEKTHPDQHAIAQLCTDQSEEET